LDILKSSLYYFEIGISKLVFAKTENLYIKSNDAGSRKQKNKGGLQKRKSIPRDIKISVKDKRDSKAGCRGRL